MRIMKPSEQKSGGGGVNIETALINVPYTGWELDEAMGRYQYPIDLTQLFNNIGDNDIVVVTKTYDSQALDPAGWVGYKDFIPYLIIDDTRKSLFKNYVRLLHPTDPSALSSGATSFTIRLLLFRQS